MGLGVVSRFSTLVEAEVACGALRSAGFHAEVFDHFFGTMRWIEQIALGGYRLVVPGQELTEAVDRLTDAQRQAPQAEGTSPRGEVGWGLAALLSGLTLGVDLAWLLLGIRGRLKRPSVSMADMIATALALNFAIVLIFWLLAFAATFIDGWLIHPQI